MSVSIKAKVCFQISEDIFSVMAAGKKMILYIRVLGFQNGIQSLTGAVELSLIIFSIIKKYFRILEKHRFGRS